jgi:HD-GYP domain-containing protein (c-di-GMP phosphodiesterase class II)
LSAPSTRISTNARLFIGTVIVSGLAVIGDSVWRLYLQPPGMQWFVLAALTLLTGSFTVKVPSQSARISVSETFVFTSVLLFGPAAGTATALLDAMVACFWLTAGARSPRRVLFNAAAPAIAIWLSSHAFFLMSGTRPGTLHLRDIGTLIVPIFAFALLYFLINTWLVAGALSTQQRTSPFSIWLRNFPSVSITYFVGGSIAMLIVVYTPRIDLTVLGIILPLLLISYLTFRTSMGRLEDANRHVNQMNDLYLSTIETLAMAVDAKDQITHGHIRRVQVYARELAIRLGVTDEHHLKAIEAAALLHDMGKLAIPEHILNKPGKLTVGEFEKMKRHSDIGADLLSSIPFPYPVVPLVRYHHENWDGSGYPNGISGTDIPLGARILSVVDCFDALTSDRPYRPRLSTEAAFTILRERSGTMYDPLIVDAFEAAYEAIAPGAIKAGQLARTLVPSQTERTVADSSSLEEIRRSATEMRDVVDTRRLLTECHGQREALEIVARLARQHTAATVVALYLYDSASDVLRCQYAVGDRSGLLIDLEIPSGERTTGWAAAHRQPVLNSAAALDLGARARRFTPPLRSALAVPFASALGQSGVTTLYSTLDEPFGDQELFIAEQIAALIGDYFDTTRIESQGPVLRFPEGPRVSPARK